MSASWDFTGRTVAITGATGGIAGAILDAMAMPGVRLILHGRDQDALNDLAERLTGRGADCSAIRGDLLENQEQLEASFRKENPDVLINNAAVYTPGTTLDVGADDIERTFRLNTLLSWRLMKAVLPGMTERGYGRIVNISSGSGSFGERLDPGHAAYAVSKAALNAITQMAAGGISGHVKINAVCPGWVRTKMGGASATRSPEEGADTALWLACLADDGPSGGFFRDRQPIPW